MNQESLVYLQSSHQLGLQISQDQSFRITIEKRFTSLSSRHIIEAVAEKINRKVDLTSPDKIVLIEVVASLTGISVIEPDGIMYVMREKYSSDYR